MKSLRPLLLQGLLTLAVGMSSTGAQAGNQQYEPLAASVQAGILNPANGRYVINTLDVAIDGCRILRFQIKADTGNRIGAAACTCGGCIFTTATSCDQKRSDKGRNQKFVHGVWKEGLESALVSTLCIKRE